MMNKWSAYLEPLEWHAFMGVRFLEPIMERDRKKFKTAKCVFCQESFYYEARMDPAPNGCMRCAALNRETKHDSAKTPPEIFVKAGQHLIFKDG